jgi:hypothetical protein
MKGGGSLNGRWRTRLPPPHFETHVRPPRTVSELFVAFFSSTKVEMKSSGGLYLNSDLFFFPIIAKVSELLNAISN